LTHLLNGVIGWVINPYSVDPYPFRAGQVHVGLAGWDATLVPVDGESEVTNRSRRFLRIYTLLNHLIDYSAFALLNIGSMHVVKLHLHT